MNIFIPKSVQETLEILNKYCSECIILGGGTLTVPMISELNPRAVILLDKIPLSYIKQIESKKIEIGSTTKISSIMGHDNLGALNIAAKSISGWAIRNMATVGGNILAGFPWGDLATLLTVLDAELLVESVNGERVLDLGKLYGDEEKRPKLQSNELIKSVSFLSPDSNTYFIKVERFKGTKRGILTIATRLIIDKEGYITAARIAFGSAFYHPLRDKIVEEFLKGKMLSADIIEKALEKISVSRLFLKDSLASEQYRSKLAKIYLRRILESYMIQISRRVT